jgi:hypothetical protein
LELRHGKGCLDSGLAVRCYLGRSYPMVLANDVRAVVAGSWVLKSLPFHSLFADYELGLRSADQLEKK